MFLQDFFKCVQFEFTLGNAFQGVSKNFQQCVCNIASHNLANYILSSIIAKWLTMSSCT